MSYKKIFLFAATLLSPILATAGNVLQLMGHVSTSTCNVLVNGVSSPIVRLPTIPASRLQSWNSSAGETAFTISLSECPVSATPVEMKTMFVARSVGETGDLANTGTARYVDLTLSANSVGYPINLRTPWISPDGLGIRLPANASSASRDYFVRYHSYRGNVTPGTVQAVVQYAIIYP